MPPPSFSRHGIMASPRVADKIVNGSVNGYDVTSAEAWRSFWVHPNRWVRPSARSCMYEYVPLQVDPHCIY